MGLSAARAALSSSESSAPARLGHEAPYITRVASAASDAFYLAGTQVAEFLLYARTFLHHQVFLELAIPAITQLLDTPMRPTVPWHSHFWARVDITPTTLRERWTVKGDVCNKKNMTRMDVGHPMHWKDEGAPERWRAWVEDEL